MRRGQRASNVGARTYSPLGTLTSEPQPDERPCDGQEGERDEERNERLGQTGDHDRFGDLVILDMSCQLKTFPRRRRETIQIQAVVPIRMPDQRQVVRSPMVQCVLQRNVKMIKKRSLPQTPSKGGGCWNPSQYFL